MSPENPGSPSRQAQLVLPSMGHGHSRLSWPLSPASCPRAGCRLQGTVTDDSRPPTKGASHRPGRAGTTKPLALRRRSHTRKGPASQSLIGDRDLNTRALAAGCRPRPLPQRLAGNNARSGNLSVVRTKQSISAPQWRHCLSPRGPVSPAAPLRNKNQKATGGGRRESGSCHVSVSPWS